MLLSHVIYIDTNVVFKDHYWTSLHARILRALAQREGIEIWFSPVVVEERERQREADLDMQVTKARGVSRAFLGFEEAVATSTAFENYVLEARQASLAIARQFYKETWSRVLPWPTPSAEDLVRRELKIRPPFSPAGAENEGQVAKGYRDTMIWLGLLDAMEDSPHTRFMLVSSDRKAFGAPGEMWPDLVTELESRGVQPHRLQHFDSVIELARVLTPLAQDAPDEDLEQMLHIAHWAEDRSQQDLVGTWDVAHETHTGLGINLMIPIEGHYDQWHLEVEALSREAEHQERWQVTGTITVTGAVNKWDYYVDTGGDPADYDLLDEINDHYLLVEATREVEILLEVTGESKDGFEVNVVSAHVL